MDLKSNKGDLAAVFLMSFRTRSQIAQLPHFIPTDLFYTAVKDLTEMQYLNFMTPSKIVQASVFQCIMLSTKCMHKWWNDNFLCHSHFQEGYRTLLQKVSISWHEVKFWLAKRFHVTIARLSFSQATASYDFFCCAIWLLVRKDIKNTAAKSPLFDLRSIPIFFHKRQISPISCVSPFKGIWAPFLRNPLETSPESYRFQKQVHSTLIEGANSWTVWYNYSCFAFLVHVFSRIIARFRYLGELPCTRWVTNSVHTNAKEFAFMGDELAVVQHDSAISKHDFV